jgi:hypothetical protein
MSDNDKFGKQILVSVIARVMDKDHCSCYCPTFYDGKCGRLWREEEPLAWWNAKKIAKQQTLKFENGLYKRLSACKRAEKGKVKLEETNE